MNTTNLFVELVVIGIGGICSLSLIVLSLFGYDWIDWNILISSTMIIPLLSITYLMGIILDRLADEIYSSYNKQLRLKIFYDNDTYHLARNYTYNYCSDRIYALFIYGRSRLRISRAWTINFILLGMSIILLVQTRLNHLSNQTQTSIIVMSIVFGLSGALISFFVWRKLALNDYKRLGETYNILLNEASKKPVC